MRDVFEPDRITPRQQPTRMKHEQLRCSSDRASFAEELFFGRPRWCVVHDGSWLEETTISLHDRLHWDDDVVQQCLRIDEGEIDAYG